MLPTKIVFSLIHFFRVINLEGLLTHADNNMKVY